MELHQLKDRPEIQQHDKIAKAYSQLEKLLSELRSRKLSSEVVVTINNEIDQVNAISFLDSQLKNQIKKSQSHILKIVEKEHRLVVKNHYRNLWLALGMAAFGIPLGVAFGASLGNMSFLAIGLPIGMAVGIAVGTAMDKKANDEGRQLNLEIL